MKIKTQLTLATLMAMGLFATGCSQQTAGADQQTASASPYQQTTQATGSQQTTQQTSQQATTAPVETVVTTPTDVATETVTKEVVRTVVDCAKCAARKPARPGKAYPKRPAGGKWTHTHPAIPGCTDSVTHTHPYTNPHHTHTYGCKGGKRPPVKHGGMKGPKRVAPKKVTPKKVAPRPAGNKWTHTHPAIPGCTDSVTHSHPYTNRNHTHHYACKKGGGVRPAPRPVVRPRPPVVRPHVVPMLPPQIVVPPVKAKGNFKGPIMMSPETRKMMQQYQQ